MVETMNEIKIGFKEMMMLNWTGGDIIQPKQLRDMVRIFISGFIVSSRMLEIGQKMIGRLQFELELMADDEWLPDDSWKWWV